MLSTTTEVAVDVLRVPYFDASTVFKPERYARLLFQNQSLPTLERGSYLAASPTPRSLFPSISCYFETLC